MAVPVFYLRKPIYLLLQHARRAIKGYEEVIKIEPFNIELDRKERVFNKNITIKNKYSVKLKIVETWIAINNYWVEELPRRPVEPISFKEPVTKKSRLETDLYSKLTTWDKEVKSGTPSKKETEVDTKLARAVCQLATLACVDLKDTCSPEELKYIEKEIDAFESSQAVTPSGEAVSRLVNFWRNEPNKTLPSFFHNTNWTCYERTDGKADDSAQWGIASSHISIASPDAEDYVQLDMYSKYVSGETHHRGVISVEPNRGHLVVQLLRNSEPMTPAFFVLELNDAMLEKQDLLVGHFLHYSVHYRKYLTKTVVWAKENNTTQPLDLTPGSAAFENIPENIKKLLYNRLRNRLTMPSEIATDNDSDRYSLFRWIEKHNSGIIDDKMLSAYTGEYFICYYHGEAWAQEQPPADVEVAASLRIDRLTIRYDQDAVEFKAEYTHARGRTSESVYRGVARYNSSTIQLVLNEYKERKGVKNNYAYSLISNNAQANFVHITVSTPLTLLEALEETIKGYTYFPGIVNGMNDSNSAPVSFRIALVKREKLVDDKTWEINRVFAPTNHLDNPIMKEIIDYFKIHSKSLSIKIDLKN